MGSIGKEASETYNTLKQIATDGMHIRTYANRYASFILGFTAYSI